MNPYLVRLLPVAMFLALTGCIVETRPRPPRPAPTVVRTVAPPATNPAETPPPLPTQEQPEVLTRGPVHEAFAEPVTEKADAGLTAPEQPPAAIVETPPAERPVGGSVVWVPGYWSWDAERKGYIWVSGCWRAAPPNRVWMPGYWARTATGWQWIPGFWTLAGQQEITYLPPPPEVTDVLPPGPPPSTDVVWVPGCWTWQQGRYVARPGYWLKQQVGWVWVPSHYTWTPRGHVFIDGHWDRTWEQRGVLFAPVFFGPRIRASVGFAFAPTITLDLGAVSASLFACPVYSHYYFGDYYDDAYVSAGIYPWFECTRFPFWYDPIFVYARWHNHRVNPQWERHEREAYHHRRDVHADRPPRTFREQNERLARPNLPARHDLPLARPLSALTANPSNGRFERVTPATREKIVRQTTEVHTFQAARTRWEGEHITTRDAPSSVSTPRVETLPTTGRRAPVERKATTVTREPRITQPERVRLPTQPSGFSEVNGTADSVPTRPTAERSYERRGRDVKSDTKGDRRRDY